MDNPMSQCDKCGRVVPSSNDVVYFDSMLDFMHGHAPVSLFGQSRHLLPVKEGEEVVCIGSPSRAQYLEGQPRDPRSEWAYKPEREALYRKAWMALLEGKHTPLLKGELPTSV